MLGAARQIGEALRDKVELPPGGGQEHRGAGTTDSAVIPVLEEASGKRAGIDFGVGMNPEFLSEGEAVHDFMAPDRIVIGGIDAPLDGPARGGLPAVPRRPRIRVNTRTAEMIKYASNALLATLISFTNELANLGSALGGIDSSEVMRGVHVSQYFRGRNQEGLPPITSFLRAGCGFGGSCLPKDVNALDRAWRARRPGDAAARRR